MLCHCHVKHCCLLSQVKSNARGNQKKKLRKSTIILVPDRPPSSQPENPKVPNNPKKQNTNNNINENETNVAVNIPQKIRSTKPENAASAPKAEGNFVDPPDSPRKMPRAVRRSTSSNGGVPLWDRNAGKSGESVSKEPEIFEARGPLRHKKTTQEEKENNRR